MIKATIFRAKFTVSFREEEKKLSFFDLFVCLCLYLFVQIGQLGPAKTNYLEEKNIANNQTNPD